jgi:hypothetical protein
MKWIKKGLIFRPDNNYDWMVSHAQRPLVDNRNDEVLRIYFGTRDRNNRTVTSFIEVAAKNPQNVLYIHDKPVLGLGKLGCFDDSGAMPSWITDSGATKYLYYTGWNTGGTVPYRNSIGVVISHDCGQTFTRLSDGPVLDRNYNEPYFCAAPCVLVDNGVWRMWYSSCIKWEIYNGKPEPFYHLKYAESADGINWRREGKVCLDFKASDEAAITTPSIIREEQIYRMWYSYRNYREYRTNTKESYRIGYAESKDGLLWDRKDEFAGIDISDATWDSEMISYPFVYKQRDQTVMMYNGNGFGKTGFGYAILEES